MPVGCPKGFDARNGGSAAGAQVTEAEAEQAQKAFEKHGRDLNAVTKELAWAKNRVVEYYYCVWKCSPEYQVILVW